MRSYEVVIQHQGGWWTVSIPELDGITQARTIKEARGMAKDYIAITLDVPLDSVDVRLVRAKLVHGRVD